MIVHNVIGGTLIVLGALLAAVAVAAPQGSAIVIQDETSLRAAPRDSAQQQAVLWQGEVVEVRGERMDHLQIYDYRRERGGFVRASQVRRITLTAPEAPELLSLVRFVHDTPGAEALGIGMVAAYVQAAPPEMLDSPAGADALDALGTFAERLALRASAGIKLSKPAEAALSAHLDVAARYGVNFATYERGGRMQMCYDGEAFRRVLAMPSTSEQRARAALALTRLDCVDPDQLPLARRRLDEWRAEVLDAVDASALPGYLKNRLLMRRAAVWSGLAFAQARNGETADAAAARALAELAGVNKNDLTDDDVHKYADAAMRASASRWAAQTAAAAPSFRNVAVTTAAGEAGETCLSLVAAKSDAKTPQAALAKRCTYGIVWANSATMNREGTALAIAVQQTATWRELWIFKKSGAGWTVSVLPPATFSPDVGYAEFAGWVPGGKQILIAREAKGDGKYRKSFEVAQLDTLAVEHQARDASLINAFQRWQDPSWNRQTLSLR